MWTNWQWGTVSPKISDSSMRGFINQQQTGIISRSTLMAYWGGDWCNYGHAWKAMMMVLRNNLDLRQLSYLGQLSVAKAKLKSPCSHSVIHKGTIYKHTFKVCSLIDEQIATEWLYWFYNDNEHFSIWLNKLSKWKK